MGFAATAALFEGQAQRERRDPERKDRLLETAGFYRKLARIAPDFPGNYRPNGKGSLRADRWRARADECRAMADHFVDPTCREQMIRLADSYDRLAVAAE